jgi:hypothetical protein
MGNSASACGHVERKKCHALFSCVRSPLASSPALGSSPAPGSSPTRCSRFPLPSALASRAFPASLSCALPSAPARQALDHASPSLVRQSSPILADGKRRMTLLIDEKRRILFTGMLLSSAPLVN